MDSLILIARVAILLVFATAGVAKLLDVAGFRETLIGFGVPFRFTRRTARLLPAAELATAVGMLFQASVRWAGVAAVLLLLLFVVAITAALRRGQELSCNCFGQLSAARIGPNTLLRNAALVLVSGLIIWRAPGSSLTAWTSSVTAADLVAAAAVISALGLLIALLHVQRTHADSAEQPADIAPHFTLVPGATLPAFRLDTADGSSVTLDALLARGLPTILVFASPVCLTCRDLVPEIGNWNAAMRGNITFAVIESAVGDVTRFAERNAVPDGLTVLLESGMDVALRYGMTITPAGLALSPGGRLLGPPATGAVEIEQMVQAVLQGVPEPMAPEAEPADVASGR